MILTCGLRSAAPAAHFNASYGCRDLEHHRFESANLDADHLAAARAFHDCGDQWPNGAARGLISDQDQTTKLRILVLDDVPVVGDLFGTGSGQKQRTEIIMFIKPRLIRLDARSVAEQFRSSLELMRETRPSFVSGPAAPVNKK